MKKGNGTKTKSLVVAIFMLCCFVPVLSFASADCRGNKCGNLVMGQAQGQMQGQSQGQSQYSSNTIRSTVNSTVKTSVNSGQIVAPTQTINEERELLAPPQITPIYLTPIQGGKIVDFTQHLPKFANKALKPLQSTDVVVDVLGVHFGNVFNRITFEEVEQMLLKVAKDYDGSKGDVRFVVRYQDSAITGGAGGGGAVSAASNSGYTGNTAAILPGITKSTYNPIFHIIFYKVEVPEAVVKVSPITIPVNDAVK